MRVARIVVVVIGILLPYLARIPGALQHGSHWLTSYFGDPGHRLGAVLFFGAFNAIAWGSVLLATMTYRSPHAVWFPAVLGFGFLAFVHSTYDLASDAQAAVGLVFIPIYSLPFILAGWLLGLVFDWVCCRRTHQASAEI